MCLSVFKHRIRIYANTSFNNIFSECLLPSADKAAIWVTTSAAPRVFGVEAETASQADTVRSHGILSCLSQSPLSETGSHPHGAEMRRGREGTVSWPGSHGRGSAGGCDWNPVQADPSASPFFLLHPWNPLPLQPSHEREHRRLSVHSRPSPRAATIAVFFIKFSR